MNKAQVNDVLDDLKNPPDIGIGLKNGMAVMGPWRWLKGNAATGILIIGSEEGKPDSYVDVEAIGVMWRFVPEMEGNGHAPACLSGQNDTWVRTAHPSLTDTHWMCEECGAAIPMKGECS
jgi:hypothetical protein